MIKVICTQYNELTFSEKYYLFYDTFCIIDDLGFNVCFSDFKQMSL